jgi:hypothetical protein
LLKRDILLENIQIKSSILDNMDLPLSLHFGKIGRIFVNIPLLFLISSPIRIEVQEVFMIVKPKDIILWKEEIVQSELVKGIKAGLEALEANFKSQLEAEL